MKAYFWGVIHNAVAHPLLITRTSVSIRFHDWTAMKWKIATEADDE